MSLRHLFGPVSAEFADQYLYRQRQEGTCFCFGPDAEVPCGPGDTWEELLGRLPAGWRPDLLALLLPYRHIPAGLWRADVPIVGLAGDWNLQFHAYRHVLPRCEVVLTDPYGVELWQRAGLPQAREANIYGLSRDLAEAQWPEGERDIDVLFVGNPHPAVQRERLAWLGRLAALQGRWRIVLQAGVFGADYQRLLGRARIVFNRGIRGECNKRAFEAVAAGALLFQEAGNLQTPQYLRAGEDCVYYRDDNLEELLERYLADENERRRLAQHARQRLPEFTFAHLWQEQLNRLECEVATLQERVRQRQAAAPPHELARCWAAVSCAHGADAALRQDVGQAARERPRDAALLNVHGVSTAVAAASPRDEQALPAAASAFQDAWGADPRHVVAGLNLAEALVALNQRHHALEQAQRTLAVLDDLTELPAAIVDAPRYPCGYDLLRVEWERAAWFHAGRRVSP